MTQLPSVSVIIPVLNDAADLELTLSALQQQTYPRDRFEIIVVDNGSTDPSVAVANRFPNVRVLYEHRYKGSPYSARNRALEIVESDIVALLDATCVPVPGWLSEAIKVFIQRKADLVGGHVTFRFASDPPSVAELYDAMANVRMREAIWLRKVAMTANLFAKRSVFEALGPFPEGLRSGGDMRWTRRATQAGYKLVFCESALVKKAARSHWALIKKQWRVGKEHPAIWAEAGQQVKLSEILRNLFSLPKLDAAKKMLAQRSPAEARGRFWRFWFVNCAVRIVAQLSYIVGWYHLRRRSRKTPPSLDL
jgi:glycosyltransferase involved in cell wall biosynthesis